MSERVEYIRGRLAALEAAAKAADGKPWRVTDDEDDLDGDRLVLFRTLRSDEGTLIITDRDGYLTTEDLQHIALNDPAAVLARVAADRAKLARLVDVAPCTDSGDSTAGDLAADMIRLMAEGLGWKEDGSE